MKMEELPTETNSSGNGLETLDLQEFMNNPEINIPERRRDLSTPGNVEWLLRNIRIYNRDIPKEIIKALLQRANKKPL